MSSDVAELIQESDALPDGWAVQPLAKLFGEVIERVDPASLSPDMGSHYVGLEHIGQGSGRLDGVGSVADVVSQKSRFRRGDILYGKLRPNLRKVARPDFDGVCSTDVIVFRAKKSADPDFLFQVLQFEPLVAHAVATAAGTKMPRTHARSILSFEIIAPPLDEQQRIAEVLRSVDQAIAANVATLASCRMLVAKLAQDVTERCKDTTTMASLGKVVTGRTPSPEQAALWGGDLPFVTPGDLVAGNVSVTRAARTLVADGGHGAAVLPANSVLVTCIGSTVGKTAIARERCVTNQQINAICCPPQIAGFVYLVCVAAYDTIVANAGKQAVPIINKSTFSGIEVPSLSGAEMAGISAMVDAIDSEIDAAQTTLETLHRTKATLMSDLLSGRMRVPA